MAAAVAGFCDSALTLSTCERPSVETSTRESRASIIRSSSVAPPGPVDEARELVGIGSLRLGRRQLGDPGIDHRRQVLPRVEARPERRLAQAGIEFRVVTKPQLVDHLLGDVARLQDEALVLDAFRVGADIGDERFDVGQARRLDADQNSRLRDIEGGHRPGGDDRSPAQHQRAERRSVPRRRQSLRIVSRKPCSSAAGARRATGSAAM